MQVRGSKRVRLVPPAATPHLRPQPVTHESANHSPADLDAPDLERFPGLGAALAEAQVFELAAGDALFIPEGWWHQVGRGGRAATERRGRGGPAAALWPVLGRAVLAL